MVRSRDFLLFALVLVLLFVGIGATLLGDIKNNQDQVAQLGEVSFDNQTLSEYHAKAVLDDVDRSSNIAKLKEKIAAGLGLSKGEPVLTFVDESPVNQDELLTDRQPQYCPGYERVPALVASWPSVGVTTTFVEGVRLVQVAEVSPTSATGTIPSFKKRTLIQLPALQQRATTDTCLNSTLVGVDTNGRLIRNNDTARYVGYDEFMLVGYARDGFPIYGFKNNTTELDACGGVQEVTGYRYYLRDQEDFVLGCFAGIPANFN